LLFDWSQGTRRLGRPLIRGVDQHHRYPMVSPGCRLVDLRVNIKGAAELGEH
jgi:hypothetical protein